MSAADTLSLREGLASSKKLIFSFFLVLLYIIIWEELYKLTVPLIGNVCGHPGPFCWLSQTKSQQGQVSCPMVGKAESASSHPQGTALPLASWRPQRPASPNQPMRLHQPV